MLKKNVAKTNALVYNNIVKAKALSIIMKKAEVVMMDSYPEPCSYYHTDKKIIRT